MIIIHNTIAKIIFNLKICSKFNGNKIKIFNCNNKTSYLNKLLYFLKIRNKYILIKILGFLEILPIIL